MRASSAMGGPINEMPTGQPSKVAPGRFICGNPVSLQYLREMTLRHLGRDSLSRYLEPRSTAQCDAGLLGR